MVGTYATSIIVLSIVGPKFNRDFLKFYTHRFIIQKIIWPCNLFFKEMKDSVRHHKTIKLLQKFTTSHNKFLTLISCLWNVVNFSYCVNSFLNYFMYFLMCPQAFCLRIWLTALGAGIRFLPSMDSLMWFEVTWFAERHLTNRAGEGPLPCMKSVMSLHFTTSRERAFTDSAGKGFLSCVSSVMSLQVSSTREGAFTDSAAKRFLSCVSSIMIL